MSMVKVIELSSESPESWEDATRQAVERASQTIRNIRSARRDSRHAERGECWRLIAC